MAFKLNLTDALKAVESKKGEVTPVKGVTTEWGHDLAPKEVAAITDMIFTPSDNMSADIVDKLNKIKKALISKAPQDVVEGELELFISCTSETAIGVLPPAAIELFASAMCYTVLTKDALKSGAEVDAMTELESFDL